MSIRTCETCEHMVVDNQVAFCPMCRLKEAESLLEDLEWSANIGQNGYGCGLCEADAYHRRGGDHYPGCKLAAFMKCRT